MPGKGTGLQIDRGIELMSDEHQRPDAEGKFPALLQRTPYDKYHGVEFGLKAAARGYVVIFEDVRAVRPLVDTVFRPLGI
jgi:hypothetical protein